MPAMCNPSCSSRYSDLWVCRLGRRFPGPKQALMPQAGPLSSPRQPPVVCASVSSPWQPGPTPRFEVAKDLGHVDSPGATPRFSLDGSGSLFGGGALVVLGWRGHCDGTVGRAVTARSHSLGGSQAPRQPSSPSPASSLPPSGLSFHCPACPARSMQVPDSARPLSGPVPSNHVPPPFFFLSTSLASPLQPLVVSPSHTTDSLEPRMILFLSRSRSRSRSHVSTLTLTVLLPRLDGIEIQITQCSPTDKVCNLPPTSLAPAESVESTWM